MAYLPKTKKMKRIIFFLALLVFASCSMMDSSGPVQETSPLVQESNPLAQSNPNQSVAPTNAWRIGLMIEEGFDLTQNFEGLEFRFSEGGALEASKNGISISGRWRLRQDSPQDELYIYFPNGTVLEELDEDWYVVENSENRMVLEDRDDEYIDRLVLVRYQDAIAPSAPFIKEKERAKEFFEKVLDSSFEGKSLLNDNRQKSAKFQGVELKFLPLGRMELRRPNQPTISGVWYLGFNDRDVKLGMDFESEGLADYLDEEWIFISRTDQLFQLVEYDDSDKDKLELLKK